MGKLQRDLYRAAQAASEYGRLTVEKRHEVLVRLSELIQKSERAILRANAADLRREGRRLSSAKRKRLELDAGKLAAIREGLLQVVALPDPLASESRSIRRPSGILVYQEAVPIGLIAMIFESRPNVVVDVFGLCFKAGNGCVLKGGREARESNAILFRLIRKALQESSVSSHGVFLISTSDRRVMKAVLKMDDAIDVVIPRGGESLIRFVTANTTIPVLRHATGVCHVFVEKSADVGRACSVILNAKVQAPATCNAAETLLLDEGLSVEPVQSLLKNLGDAGVEVRGCSKSKSRFGRQYFSPRAPKFDREYLDLVLNCRTVRGLQAACDHIHEFGSDHTDSIITEDAAAWMEFRRRVQSSCVLLNATTRFNDGFQLGLGAELGINTTRLHAFGPMGLEALTVRRFVVEGEYSVRS